MAIAAQHGGQQHQPAEAFQQGLLASTEMPTIPICAAMPGTTTGEQRSRRREKKDGSAVTERGRAHPGPLSWRIDRDQNI